MGVSDNALLELQWATEHWALKETGTGLYEATQKQVSYIVSLIDGVPRSESHKVDALLLQAGLPSDWDTSSLLKLTSTKASQLIDKLKQLAPSGAGLVGQATSSQIGYMKSLLAKVDPLHGDIMVAFKGVGVNYPPTGPGPSHEDLSAMSKANASKMIDWLKQNWMKYKPGVVQPKITQAQYDMINDLESDLLDFEKIDVPYINSLKLQAQLSTSTPVKNYTQDMAAAYIAALSQALETEKAKKASASAAIPMATQMQINSIVSMAKATGFKAAPLKKAGVGKYKAEQDVASLSMADASQLAKALLPFMVGPQQLSKLKKLIGKVAQMGDAQHQAVNALLSPYGVTYPDMWTNISDQLELTLSKQNATTLIKQLTSPWIMVALTKATAQKASTAQVGQVLGLLMKIGPQNWKGSKLAKQYSPADLRTANLKKMTHNEIEDFIIQLGALKGQLGILG